jgi:hypothetical protein
MYKINHTLKSQLFFKKGTAGWFLFDQPERYTRLALVLLVDATDKK